MAQSKSGVKRGKPSHKRYNSENHRVRNKILRITKCNGIDFLARWKAQYA